jgi:acetylornithine deacetylase/succinyl-diaminopimelate desuccinylase-like protein
VLQYTTHRSYASRLLVLGLSARVWREDTFMTDNLKRAIEAVAPDLVIELASGLCRRPSPRPNEKPAATYLADQLERLGFEVELQDVVENRPNVVAILRGDPDYQSCLLNGHLDHPDAAGTWGHDPTDPWIEDGILHGEGIQDMKGGMAALCAGAAAVARVPLERRGDVILTAVMHHDTTGVGTKYFLDACPWRIDTGLNGEPTNLAVQLFHGGAWIWEVETIGLSRHVCRAEEGVNAIDGMLRILDRLDLGALTYTPDPDHSYLPRLVIGTVQGGGLASSTAERCIAQGDLRFLPSMEVDQLKTDFRRVVDKVCAETPGLTGRVRTVRQQWPYQIAEAEPVIQSVIAAHALVTGRAPKVSEGLPAGSFITDAADMVRRGIPTAIYGPADWNTTPNEGIPVTDLVTAARVYAAATIDLTTRKREG